jgi:hypothetical protein
VSLSAHDPQFTDMLKRSIIVRLCQDKLRTATGSKTNSLGSNRWRARSGWMTTLWRVEARRSPAFSGSLTTASDHWYI